MTRPAPGWSSGCHGQKGGDELGHGFRLQASTAACGPALHYLLPVLFLFVDKNPEVSLMFYAKACRK